MGDQLTDSGYRVRLASGGEEAIALVREKLFDVVICDLRMEKADGFDVLEAAKATEPPPAVLLMTAFGAIDTAVEAIKRGAYHYVAKPFAYEELLVFVQRALRERQLTDENRALRRMAEQRVGLGAMVGKSRAMLNLFEVVERIAASQAPVLVRGESGTGKELVARGIHHHSPRKDSPFVAVNCTALSEQLLESELFGHVRGAFTGATTTRRGLLVEADGGTLFLDEIGDMAPVLQTKLLRVLEDGEIRPVGADTSRKVDVRIVAATNQDIEARIKEGKFRADLYFRLNVLPVVIPALRDRPEDIPSLVAHFLEQARARYSAAKVRKVSEAALHALSRFSWPGNVRELENVVERAVIVCGKESVELADLANIAPGLTEGPSPLDAAKQSLVTLRQLEAEYIRHVIDRCQGNKTKAAEILGIDVSTIHRREREREDPVR
ncbi:MAG: sigma-54 dependent transcriptional regulator [Myxococcales bacterium]